MAKKRSWTKDDLSFAVSKSKTLREVSLCLNLSGKGGSISSVKKGIIEFGFSTEHFSCRSKSHPDNVKRLTDEDIFNAKSSVSSGGVVKTRILKRKLIEYICSECGQKPFHCGKVLTLQLEHKNGNNRDNSLVNLTFLCPNCHSQTATYCRGKKR